MITYNDAKRIILTKYLDSKVIAAFELPNCYIFSIKPRNWKSDEYVLDGFFKVSKEDGGITEYSPVMDPEEFRMALASKIE